MMQLRPILSWIFIAMAALPAAAAPRRYAITTERIAAALSNGGVPVLPEQVTLPANVVASTADPVLKVMSIDRAGGQRALARLECASSQQCLPFIVTLRVSMEPAEASPRVQAAVFSSPRPSTPLVRAGSPATLHLEGAHIHISLSVICLENGAMGQTIRATSKDRHQVYTVQVVRDGVLEGRL
jgi:hypothetical protein